MLIEDEERAKKLAEQLVQQFYDENRETIEENRKMGDSLGVAFGKPLHQKLRALRMGYLSNVSREIGFRHKFFNLAVVRIVLQR